MKILLIETNKNGRIFTYAPAAFSLTVSTRLLASFSALCLLASFDASDFFSSTLSFTASIPNPKKKDSFFFNQIQPQNSPLLTRSPTD